MRIKGKRILIGVSGGVAAYKALEVVRLLAAEGAVCQAILTHSATRLVQPESFEALTGRRAASDLWEDDHEFRSTVPFGPTRKPIHIALAQEADLFLIVPATANVMAKMSAGIADDLLTTACLAAACPIVIVPAMNSYMWEHPATQRNVVRLRADGAYIIEPEEGDLACEQSGIGRLAPPKKIVDEVGAILANSGDLAGRKILITGGRTEEPIDPVRVISNRSSGRMAVALVRQAVARGADVVFLSGGLSVPPPEGALVVDCPTVESMGASLREIAPGCEAVIMAAAVGDFKPKRVSEGKIKRSGPLTIELEPTEDLIASLGRNRGAIRVLVGFALETDSPEERGREKMERKRLDMVVVNRPEVPGGGIGLDSTEVVLLGKDGFREEAPLSSKNEIAARILNRIVFLLQKD